MPPKNLGKKSYRNKDRTAAKIGAELYYNARGWRPFIGTLRDTYEPEPSFVSEPSSSYESLGNYFEHLALIEQIDLDKIEKTLFNDLLAAEAELKRQNLHPSSSSRKFQRINDLISDRSTKMGWAAITGRSDAGNRALLEYITHRWGIRDPHWHNRFDFVFQLKLDLIKKSDFWDGLRPDLSSDIGDLSWLIYKSLSLDASTEFSFDDIYACLTKESFNITTLLLLDGFDKIQSLYGVGEGYDVRVTALIDRAMQFFNGIITSRLNTIPQSLIVKGGFEKKYFENIGLTEEKTCQYIQLIHAMRQHYAEDNKLPKLIEDPSIEHSTLEKCFVNLVLIGQIEYAKQEKMKLSGKAAAELALDRGELYQSFLESGDFWGVNDLIDLSNDVDTPMGWTAITGRAGTGKTTLLQYISYHAGKGDLAWHHRFDFVFRVKLNLMGQENFWDGMPEHLKLKGEMGDLSWLIHKSLAEISRARMFSADDIYACLTRETFPIKTLFLLDGFDEIASLYGHDRRVIALIDRAMQFPNGILTSRPNAIPQPWIKEGRFKVRLENIGLTKDNVRQYILSYFAFEPTLGESLLAELERNPEMMSFAQIPVTLSALCLTWNDEAKEDVTNKKTLTMTILYSQVILWIARRYYAKCKMTTEIKAADLQLGNQIEVPDFQMLELCHRELQALAFLAYDAFKKNQLQSLDPDLIKKHFANQRELLPILRSKWGVLRAFERAETGKYPRHYFIHLTYQEYFVALYMAQQLRVKPFKENREQEIERRKNIREIIDMIRENKDKKHCEVVFTFLAGLVSMPEYAEGATYFWSAYSDMPSAPSTSVLPVIGLHPHIKAIADHQSEYHETLTAYTDSKISEVPSVFSEKPELQKALQLTTASLPVINQHPHAQIVTTYRRLYNEALMTYAASKDDEDADVSLILSTELQQVLQAIQHWLLLFDIKELDLSLGTKREKILPQHYREILMCSKKFQSLPLILLFFSIPLWIKSIITLRQASTPEKSEFIRKEALEILGEIGVDPDDMSMLWFYRKIFSDYIDCRYMNCEVHQLYQMAAKYLSKTDNDLDIDADFDVEALMRSFINDYPSSSRRANKNLNETRFYGFENTWAALKTFSQVLIDKNEALYLDLCTGSISIDTTQDCEVLRMFLEAFKIIEKNILKNHEQIQLFLKYSTWPLSFSGFSVSEGLSSYRSVMTTILSINSTLYATLPSLLTDETAQRFFVITVWLNMKTLLIDAKNSQLILDGEVFRLEGAAEEWQHFSDQMQVYQKEFIDSLVAETSSPDLGESMRLLTKPIVFMPETFVTDISDLDSDLPKDPEEEKAKELEVIRSDIHEVRQEQTVTRAGMGVLEVRIVGVEESTAELTEEMKLLKGQNQKWQLSLERTVEFFQAKMDNLSLRLRMNEMAIEELRKKVTALQDATNSVTAFVKTLEESLTRIGNDQEAMKALQQELSDKIEKQNKLLDTLQEALISNDIRIALTPEQEMYVRHFKQTVSRIYMAAMVISTGLFKTDSCGPWRQAAKIMDFFAGVTPFAGSGMKILSYLLNAADEVILQLRMNRLLNLGSDLVEVIQLSERIAVKLLGFLDVDLDGELISEEEVDTAVSVASDVVDLVAGGDSLGTAIIQETTSFLFSKIKEKIVGAKPKMPVEDRAEQDANALITRISDNGTPEKISLQEKHSVLLFYAAPLLSIADSLFIRILSTFCDMQSTHGKQYQAENLIWDSSKQKIFHRNLTENWERRSCEIEECLTEQTERKKFITGMVKCYSEYTDNSGVERGVFYFDSSRSHIRTFFTRTATGKEHVCIYNNAISPDAADAVLGAWLSRR